MNKINETITYEMVDCEGLATCLAEDAWLEEVKAKGLTTEDLYDTVVVAGSDVMQKHIKAEWAHNFFTLRDGYLALINAHKRDKTSCISSGRGMK